MDSSLLSVPLACYVYGYMVLVIVVCGISTVMYLVGCLVAGLV